MNKEERSSILYITYDGITDHIGQSQILPYIYALSRKGFRFILLSVEKKERLVLYPELYSRLKKENVTWEYIQYSHNPPIISSVYDVIKLSKFAHKLVREYNIQVVHCRSYMASIIGLNLKKKLGVKFVFDKRDFWADAGAETKRFNRDNPILNQVYLYFKRKEKAFVGNADCIVSLTSNAKDVVSKWSFYDESKTFIEVIPCCTDLQHFNKNKFSLEELSIKRAELGIAKEDFLLVYSGSVGPAYMMDEMLLFFKALHSNNPNIKMLFIVNNGKEEVLNKVNKLGITRNSIVITSTNRHGMPKLLSIADLAIFFIFPTFAKKASSPTKFGEYLSMQLPVVCNAEVGDNNLILTKYKVGWLVSEYTSDEYNKIVKSILSSNEHESYQKNAKDCAEDYFDLKIGVEKYGKIYDQLLTTSI